MSTPTRTHRTQKQRFEAVQLYLLLGGSAVKTARALKIPDQTLFTWKKTDWWHEYEAQIRREENLELSARLQKAIGKGMEIVADRLENGDWIYDQKSGEMRRKPVALRDAQKTVTDFIDKRAQLVENQQLTIAAEQIDEKLNKLAAAFAKLSQPQVNVTDVVFIEDNDTELAEFVEEDNDYAMDEGREEGLQT